jgi:hypothetical protein
VQPPTALCHGVGRARVRRSAGLVRRVGLVGLAGIVALLVAGAAFGQAPEPVPSPAPPPPAVQEPAAQEPAPPASPAPPLPAAADPAAAVEPAPTPPDPDADPEQEEEEEAAVAPPERQRERFLPRLDVYFPEGDLDLRVNRLINKVFFEGQVKYNFLDGDITAFLRYRYYGASRVTQFTVFDAVEFEDVEKLSNEFDRVRGTLLLLQWPHSYHQRTFALFEIDRIFSNKPALQFNNNRTNTYVRLGYQVGTPGDARSNAIAGETRARSERLFTAVREIGPGGAGFTGAVTYGFDWLNGSFDYIKLEAEALKRFDVTANTFLVGRVHGGTFLDKQLIRDDPELEPVDQFSIPRSEYFRLDGRDNLRGLKERRRGTEELHTTWEYFFPWFLGASHQFLRLEWQNWYWILYSGIGTVGFDRDVYSDFDTYVPDVGIGFESSFRLRRKYRFFLSGIVAQALKGSGGVEARISVKSYR